MNALSETNRLIAELRSTLAETEKLVKGFKFDARADYKKQYKLLVEAKENESETDPT